MESAQFSKPQLFFNGLSKLKSRVPTTTNLSNSKTLLLPFLSHNKHGWNDIKIGMLFSQKNILITAETCWDS